jgi:hypothetical protein
MVALFLGRRDASISALAPPPIIMILLSMGYYSGSYTQSAHIRITITQKKGLIL